MNRKYNLKLDLQFRCNNSIMKFNQFDNNTSDFFMRITNGGNLVDVEKAIVVLAAIKPSGKVASQFVEVKNGLVYADLKPSMKDEIGTYAAQAMLILEDERVVTDVISYEVEEDKIFSLLNDTVETSEEFTLLTDMLSRLSNIEISEEQRVINEAERILSEENRKIEEVKRVEAELIRQHEEADRAKYDATRESNENIRKQNESIRLANETNRIDEEAKRVEEEDKRKLAEEERNANYNFMTEDEERRRSEANAHKEAEALRVQAETNRIDEEAKRRTTEQARVSVENTRVSNENAREANEVVRKNNETKRVEAETQRQNRYNSFISDAESNANNFENYTNNAKVKEEERKANELDRKSQEDRRVSNEVERISNENTRKANEVVREKNEASRQNTFANKVSEVDAKISELNTTKDNFVSSVNTKVDTKISELDTAKSDMTNTVSNKVNEVENRFNALTSKQQQDAEVIDARDGETSLKARLDRDIEKANKELDKIKKLEESTVSTVTTESDFTTVEATSNGYFEDVKLEGKTLTTVLTCSTNKNYAKWTPVDCASYKAVEVGKVYTIIAQTNNTAQCGLKNKTSADYLLALAAAKEFICKTITFSKAEELVIVTDTEGTVNMELMIVEGDHTQNPPSYFEGLKSVGQSASEDGADEIVVSSMEKNIVKYTKKIIKSDGYACDFEGISSNDVYYHNLSDKKIRLHIKNNNTYVGNITIHPKTSIQYELSDGNVTYAVTLTSDYGWEMQEYDIDRIFAITRNNQSDKKRLLYYNNETQTWEKPILREWDSIEKHADGKYYYHQRSGEVVLNGSENWGLNAGWSGEEMSTNSYYLTADGQKTAGLMIKSNGATNIISEVMPTVFINSTSFDSDCVSGENYSSAIYIRINKSKVLNGIKPYLQQNPMRVVYQLAEEKVYECTNIDLITYANETNYIVESGAIVPRSTLKVHNNISNVVSLLQKKVSLLENNITSYMITQNRLMLASRYNADNVTFKVDYPSMMSEREVEIDYDLFKLIQDNIIVGPKNYDVDKMLEIMDLYAMIGFITWEMWDYLYEVIYSQINPVIEDLEGTPEI